MKTYKASADLPNGSTITVEADTTLQAMVDLRCAVNALIDKSRSAPVMPAELSNPNPFSKSGGAKS